MGKAGMAHDIISKKTRYEFQEFFVGWTLREIDREFDAAGIECDHGFQPEVSGQRRARVAQFYNTLDFTDGKDVRKALRLFENVLNTLEEQAMGDYAEEVQRSARRQLDELTRWLRKDGFAYEGGQLLPVGGDAQLSAVEQAAIPFDGPELRRQVERMQKAVDDDPGLAVGTAKELIETTCKTILTERGIDIEPGWDVPQLVKQTRKCLGLLPEQIPDSAKGAA